MMMKIFIASLAAVFFGACTHAPDPTHADFRKVLAIENVKLAKKLEEDKSFKFLSYTKERYFADMEKQNADIVKHMRTFEETQFGTANTVFVICMKSAGIAMCDSSSSPTVDRVKTGDTLPDLKKLMDEIRGP